MSDIQSTTNSETSQLFATMPTGVEFKKLRKRLLRQTSEALGRFGMVQPGARWLVALSGGKDSYGLLAILLDLKARDQLPVELIACNLDQGQPGFPKDVLPTYLKSLGVQHHIEYRDTYSIVKEKVPEGATYCGLCSRLRRANLYRIAREKGCTSVVLGHHRDDILETFLMNMFHGGRLAAMPPKLLNDEGDLTLLRPLSFCAEEDLQRFSDAMQFPIIPCNLCGSQDGLQRVMMKKMLADMEKADPGRKERMMSAIANINPSHMLDHNLFNFASLQPADQ
ncbi:tRNA 2-thiocytidine(32) synthetase TtcA [Maritalea porphyrae]|nr:tRNA 2-thiocytidine(32) synthetase TtcA [Maritalea porphyrae]MCZ4272742.1 tRNA 2-thiocytidine(32) synthetase TtcA [Maritalea porphyrae]